jgi:hypothetical protein
VDYGSVVPARKLIASVGASFAEGGEGVILYASQATDGKLHLIICNHESAAHNVTVQLSGAAVSLGDATVARVDDTHANAFTVSTMPVSMHHTASWLPKYHRVEL